MERVEQVYFVGAGGIGMSALARYFLSQGKAVAGYDRVSTALTDQLSREGAMLHFEDDIELIPQECRNPDSCLVIYTPAIPAGHRELAWLREKGFRVIKRSVALGELFKSGRGIGVAGTHGKTSISTTLAHLLHGSSLGCNAFLGGISKNTHSNLYLDPRSDFIVAEADEYDRSFLTLFPEAAVLSSMDADHLDIYGSEESIQKGFEDFLAQISPGGFLVHKYGLHPRLGGEVRKFSYALEDPGADYHARDLVRQGTRSSFSIVTPTEEIKDLELGIPGTLNVENAIAAVAVAWQLGVSADALRAGLGSYQGVERRFDVQLQRDDRIYIDDYAHHPTEITAFLTSVRRLFPGKRITGVFQPHLFTRTRDFAEGFARSLALLDELILLDIYPAREEPIPGVSSSIIFDRVELVEKVLISRDQLMRVVEERKPELLLTMGAGDINQFVAPLKSYMEQA